MCSLHSFLNLNPRMEHLVHPPRLLFPCHVNSFERRKGTRETRRTTNSSRMSQQITASNANNNERLKSFKLSLILLRLKTALLYLALLHVASSSSAAFTTDKRN